MNGTITRQRSIYAAGTILAKIAASFSIILASHDSAFAADAASTDSDVSQVTVHAQKAAAKVNSGALGSRSILEAPYSISAVTDAQIKTLGAPDINVTFNYDSSVKANNSSVASGTTFSVRGLPLDRTNGYKLDGLAYPYWFQDIPLEHFQDVELLKGVGGFLYGFATPGGILNFESKQPTSSFTASASVGVRSSNIVTEDLDVGGPITALGDTKFRFNVVHEAGALYNTNFNEEHSASFTFTGSVTPDVTWSLNGLYVRSLQKNQVNTIEPSPTEGAVTNLKPVNADLQVGALGARKTNDYPELTPQLNWQINPNWTANLSYRYSVLDERFPGNVAEIVNNAGEYVSIGANVDRFFKYNAIQTSVEGKFDTGPLSHDVVLGGSATNVIFNDFDPPPEGVLGYGNIYSGGTAPSIVGNPVGIAVDHVAVHWTLFQQIWQDAAFLSDTIKWDRWSLLAGLRYNDYAERDFNRYEQDYGAGTGDYNLHPTTPSYALTYDLAPQTKVYVSYAEALQTGSQAPATGVYNTNAFLAPITSRQYEAGIKGSAGIVSATAAIYQIDTPLGIYGADQPGTTLPVYNESGLGRYRGVEVNGTVRASDDLTINVSGSYQNDVYISGTTLLDNVVTSATGKLIPGTSHLEGNLFASYNLPWFQDVSVNGGVRYIGKGYADTLNLLEFPATTVFDLGASYTATIHNTAVITRLAVQNVGNLEYWTYALGKVSPAPPRTFSLNTEFDF